MILSACKIGKNNTLIQWNFLTACMQWSHPQACYIFNNTKTKTKIIQNNTNKTVA